MDKKFTIRLSAILACIAVIVIRYFQAKAGTMPFDAWYVPFVRMPWLETFGFFAIIGLACEVIRILWEYRDN